MKTGYGAMSGSFSRALEKNRDSPAPANGIETISRGVVLAPHHLYMAIFEFLNDK